MRQYIGIIFLIVLWYDFCVDQKVYLGVWMSFRYDILGLVNFSSCVSVNILTN